MTIDKKIVNSILMLYQIAWTTVENYKLLIRLKKKTPASDHALSDRVITRGKQTVVLSGEISNFISNHDQKKKIINHNLPTNACQTTVTDNNIYLVDAVPN